MLGSEIHNCGYSSFSVQHLSSLNIWIDSSHPILFGQTTIFLEIKGVVTPGKYDRSFALVRCKGKKKLYIVAILVRTSHMTTSASLVG